MRVPPLVLSRAKLAIMACIAGIVYSAAPVGAAMTHRYTFDGPDVTDSVGQAHGTSVCASVHGGVLSLGGDQSYVQLAGKIVPSSGSFTVMLFAKETAPVAGFIELVSQGDGSSSRKFYFGHSPTYFIRAGD